MRRPEHDPADRGDEQDDRGDLEREQVVGEEELADRCRAPERIRDLGRILEVVTPREPEHDDDLDEERDGRDHRRRLQDRRSARPGGVRATAEIGDDEEEHDHHRAGVHEHLRGRQELRRQQEVEDGERGQVPDQREGGVERVREGDDGDAAPETGARRQEPHDPHEDVAHRSQTNPLARILVAQIPKGVRFAAAVSVVTLAAFMSSSCRTARGCRSAPCRRPERA